MASLTPKPASARVQHVRGDRAQHDFPRLPGVDDNDLRDPIGESGSAVVAPRTPRSELVLPSSHRHAVGVQQDGEIGAAVEQQPPPEAQGDDETGGSWVAVALTNVL